MIKAIPRINNINIKANVPLTRGCTDLNSFHINTPHKAATKVAPCPKPYEIAAPALPAVTSPHI